MNQPDFVPNQAICTRDSVCQLNGKFVIPEGAQVTILQTQPQIKLFRISYRGREGAFLMRDFTPLQP